jgi:hypothetical protein
VTSSRPLIVALLFSAWNVCARDAHAIDIAPGTTSPTLQAEGCATASGSVIGPCFDCAADCILEANTAEAALSISNAEAGRTFVEATAYTDFTVTPSPDGAETSLGGTISYDVSWSGGWTIVGGFIGYNDAESAVTLTLTDRTNGVTVRSSVLHTQEFEGFIDIDIVGFGTGVDEDRTVNTINVRLVRGHTYRLGLKIRCEARGLLNATVILDYLDGNWGVKWNDMKVTIDTDLAEEIEELKRRIAALEDHTHTYLTGRGEGHNNTEAATSTPILLVEDPSAEEQRLLPVEVSDAEPLPVKSVFLTNAPNPFNPATTITYSLPEPLHVSIRLYTVDGQLARTLLDEDRAAGPHALAFDGTGLASGVYYYHLTAGRFTETRKLTLLK